MLPTSPSLLLVLRLGLLVATFGWGISFYFLFAPWSGSELWLRQMGAEPIAYQPLLHYWLKMAASVFGCVALAAALACRWPVRFLAVIWLLVPFHLIVGSVLVVTSVQNGFAFKEQPTFIPDIVFCFSVAVLIGVPLLQAWRSQPSMKERPR